MDKGAIIYPKHFLELWKRCTIIKLIALDYTSFVTFCRKILPAPFLAENKLQLLGAIIYQTKNLHSTWWPGDITRVWSWALSHHIFSERTKHWYNFLPIFSHRMQDTMKNWRSLAHSSVNCVLFGFNFPILIVFL